MSDRRRVLSPDELMPEYEALLKAGAELPLTVTGSSMLPFLSPGRDTVFIKACGGELRKGDIVFFRRADGSYVLHRLCRCDGNDLYLVGDAQDTVEGPVDKSRAFAVVTKVIRNGRELGSGDLCWEFFAKIWIKTVGLRCRLFKIF